jgi:hypothetical protein
MLSTFTAPQCVCSSVYAAGLQSGTGEKECCDTTETDAGSSKKTATKREVGMVIDINTRTGERIATCS